MKTNSFKLLITLFTIIVCLSVFAQGPPQGQGNRGNREGDNPQRGGRPDASEILKMLDTNNDDVIDKDEASKGRRGKIAEDFDEIDTNNDNVISLEEIEESLNNRKPRKVPVEKIIKEVDANQDGVLDQLEVEAKERKALVKNFKEIDTNGDATLDKDELKAFYAKNNKKRKPRGQRR